MFRAIFTRYIDPTNSRGSRVKAIARKREGDMPELSLTDDWNYAHGIEENHCRVAQLFAVRMKWSGLYIGGSTDDGSIFVNAGDAHWARDDWPVGAEGRDWFYVARRED